MRQRKGTLQCEMAEFTKEVKRKKNLEMTKLGRKQKQINPMNTASGKQKGKKEKKWKSSKK